MVRAGVRCGAVVVGMAVGGWGGGELRVWMCVWVRVCVWCGCVWVWVLVWVRVREGACVRVRVHGCGLCAWLGGIPGYYGAYICLGCEVFAALLIAFSISI